MKPEHDTNVLRVNRGEPTYDGVRRVSGLRGDLAVSAEDPTPRGANIPLKNRTPTLSLRVFCALCFFSGMRGSVWGLQRRLRGP